MRKSPFPIKSYFPVAVLAERGVDAKALVCKINSTYIARVVFFSRIRLPQILGPDVMEALREAQCKVVVVAANPLDPAPMIKAVDLLSMSARNVGVIVSGDMWNPQTVVEAMRKGAREFLERDAKVSEMSEAIGRIYEPPPDDDLSFSPYGPLPPSDSGPSGGSVPPQAVLVGVPRPRGPKTLPPRKAIPESGTVFFPF